MKLLFIGDIFGKPGRKVLSRLLPDLRSEVGADLVVANGENVAGGVGITVDTAEECFGAGVDVITGGNHIWDKEEGVALVDRDERILRPVNYPPGTPGRGYGFFQVGVDRVVVISVLGRIFMQPFDDPFRALDAVLEKTSQVTRTVLVDVHAEATSEKCALAWYLDGRVSAVIGTHTHVQTADERIFPHGTAFLTDVGMTGPHDSIIGVRKELALRRMRVQMPVRFQPADGDLRLHGVLIEIDQETGRARGIERIQRRWEP
jgi:2',3'-cyclic-nucleotide 2'-phosphodiesterase